MLWLVAAALAAVPVRLPAGQAPELWARPLSVAGLGVGAGGSGAWVELVDEGSRWRVRVHDRSGAVREAAVKEPSTEAEREDLAWLASSLLQPVLSSAVAKPDVSPAPSLPPPPALPPPPTRPPVTTPKPPVAVVPKAAPVVPPPVVVTPVVEVAPPPVLAPAVDVPAVASAEPPAASSARVAPEPAPVVGPEVVAEPSVSPWMAAPAGTDEATVTVPDRTPFRWSAALGTGLAWRPGHSPSSSSWLRVETWATREVVLGLVFGAQSPAGVDIAGDGRVVVAADALFVASVRGQGRIAGRGGLGMGGAWRWYSDDGVPVANGPVLVAGAEGGMDLRLARWVTLGPDAGIRLDLRQTEVSVDGGAVESLSPVEMRIGLTLRIERDPADPSLR